MKVKNNASEYFKLDLEHRVSKVIESFEYLSELLLDIDKMNMPPDITEFADSQMKRFEMAINELEIKK